MHMNSQLNTLILSEDEKQELIAAKTKLDKLEKELQDADKLIASQRKPTGLMLITKDGLKSFVDSGMMFQGNKMLQSIFLREIGPVGPISPCTTDIDITADKTREYCFHAFFGYPGSRFAIYREK